LKESSPQLLSGTRVSWDAHRSDQRSSALICGNVFGQAP
jgi:hypothetical protein